MKKSYQFNLTRSTKRITLLKNNKTIEVFMQMKEVFELKTGDEKSKEEHMADYLESLKAIEEAMEPYKDQKRDNRQRRIRNLYSRLTNVMDNL